MKEFLKQNLFLVFIVIFLVFTLLCALVGYSASSQNYTQKDSISKLPWSMSPTDQYPVIFSSEVPGQFEVYDEDKVLLIDAEGKVLKELDDPDNDLGEGFHLFKKDDDYGVRDKDGRIIIEANYKNIDEFHHGYASAWNGVHHELLDKNGHKVLSNLLISEITYIGDGKFFVNAGRHYILDVDTGKEISLPSKIIGITTDGNDSYMARLSGDTFCYLSKDFTIPRGAVLYGELPEYSEGLAYAKRYDDLIVDEKHNIPLTRGHTPACGYMNKNHELVLPLPYKDIQKCSPFSEGKALIYADKKVICIDTEGKELFTLEDSNRQDWYESTFSGGYVSLTLDGKKEGIINDKGEFVIEPLFNFIGRIQGGYAVVNYKDKYGILDLNQLKSS